MVQETTTKSNSFCDELKELKQKENMEFRTNSRDLWLELKNNYDERQKIQLKMDEIYQKRREYIDDLLEKEEEVCNQIRKEREKGSDANFFNVELESLDLMFLADLDEDRGGVLEDIYMYTKDLNDINVRTQVIHLICFRNYIIDAYDLVGQERINEESWYQEIAEKLVDSDILYDSVDASNRIFGAIELCSLYDYARGIDRIKIYDYLQKIGNENPQKKQLVEDVKYEFVKNLTWH